MLEGVTVKLTGLLLTPPAVAVMVVLPGRSPVAKPLLSILANVGLLVFHVTVAPEITFPVASFAVATNCRPIPAEIVVADGVKVIEATVEGIIVNVL